MTIQTTNYGDYRIIDKIDNQTIEILFQFEDEYYVYNKGKKIKRVIFNIALEVYNKRKHIYNNENKKLSTGKIPFTTVIKGIKMFKELEQYVIEDNPYQEIIFFCTWLDNRRRNAYHKILSKYGYDYGFLFNKKCIMKKVLTFN